MNRKLKWEVLERDNFTCRYCKRMCTVDHVRPKSKEGRDRKSNLVCACFECNQAKADKYPIKQKI